LHPGMILTIFRKDVRDAIRDSRVLAALLIPLGIGLFYNFTFDDDEFEVPPVDVVYVTEGETRLPDVLRDITSGSADLEFTQLDSADEVRQQIIDEDADLGLAIPAGFDAAVAAGEAPPLEIIIHEEASSGANYVAAALEQALQIMAGREPPATVQVDVISAEESSEDFTVFEELGPRQYFVLVSVVMLVGMNAMLVVPIILAEEVEKKTIDALVMIASYIDVVVAKALVGLVYVGLSTAALLGLTGLRPEDPLLFGVALLLLAVCLIGFGLLIGSIFTNANQVNTWAGFFLIPVIAPAFMVGLPLPDGLKVAIDFLPTSHATRLLINGLAGQSLFSGVALAFVVVAVWIFIAYGLMTLRLSRRQA